MSAEEKCKKCGRPQKKNTFTCPHCGHIQWEWIIGLTLLSMVICVVGVGVGAGGYKSGAGICMLFAFLLAGWALWTAIGGVIEVMKLPFGPPKVARLESQGNVEELIKALGFKEEATVRQAAAESLGKIGDIRAVEPLTITLKDGNRHVREAATEALDRIGWQPDRDETAAYYWIMKRQWDKCVEIGATAVEPLIVALRSTSYSIDMQTRQEAAQTLGRIGDARAVKPLIAALEDIHLCERAIEALREIGMPAVEPLIADLQDMGKSEGARIGVARALGQIGGTGAVEPLIATLKDRLASLRMISAEVLGQIGDPRAIEHLAHALEDNDENVRLSVIRALGVVGDTRVVDPLSRALKDKSATVQKAAAEALGKTKTRYGQG